MSGSALKERALTSDASEKLTGERLDVSVGEGVVRVLLEEVKNRGTEQRRHEADVTLEIELVFYPDAFALR